ncbi:glycosyltransferase [Candidatus Fonsibacter ubiquis]|uniref:glycosyltransferase n=1 Tax=Candidatus Fonsibacter ubiquis TaxID=1925548 RepID=UPI000C0853FB|nr:glycosyltransferase [Candidatus Fonsibacter ubiquis]
MKDKKEIAVLLPNKEDFSTNNAAAASIWVRDFNRGEIINKQIVFGIATSSPLTKNFINLKKTNLIDNSYFYLKNFIKKLTNSIKIIEIHNRPHFFFFLKKKFPKYKFILIFHNDPNTLRGSKTIEDKIEILERCDEIVFVSNYVKQRFYHNIYSYIPVKGHIIYPATNYFNHNFKKKLKKKKTIIFVGKLNSSKGYNVFGNAVIDILNKYKDWHVIAAGNEKRESYIFNHKRFKILNWSSHKKIINLYKSTSISIVPSQWHEPFGRTAMESSDLGNALITSGKGGLLETANNPIVLKKVNKKNIVKEVEKLIKSPILLKKIQKFNYKNRRINFKDNLKKLNGLKLHMIKDHDYNFNIKKNIIRVLHISNFSERSDYRLLNINLANKISNGLNNEYVQAINFSDRAFSKLNNFSSIDNKIFRIVANLRPNLVLLGHTNSLKVETLKNIKDKFSDTKFAFWYEDSINKKGPDFNKNKIFIEKYKDYIDNFFITTDINNVEASIPKNKLNYIPIPCDKFTENLNLSKITNHMYDIFFAVSHGVNRGILKKDKIDSREGFVRNILTKSVDISFNIFGFNNIQPTWGDKFNYEMSKCRFGLNLSRGEPIKYYSSNRIASYIANGLPTLIDEKVKFNDFFTSNEMIFYKDVEDLIDKVNFYKKNERLRARIGLNGKKKYFKIFNNVIIGDYILSKTLGLKPSYKFAWDK